MIFKLVSVQISKLYECIPRSAVDKFVNLCLLCHARKQQSIHAPLKPIGQLPRQGNFPAVKEDVEDIIKEDEEEEDKVNLLQDQSLGKGQ